MAEIALHQWRRFSGLIGRPDFDEIVSRAVSIDQLGDSGGFRFNFANDRSVDYWTTTGTFMEPGSGRSFKYQPTARFFEFALELSNAPTIREHFGSHVADLSDQTLAIRASLTYPVDPRLHPQAILDRSLIHEMSARLLALNTLELTKGMEIA